MVGIFHFHGMNSEPSTPPLLPNSTADSSEMSLFEYLFVLSVGLSGGVPIGLCK